MSGKKGKKTKGQTVSLQDFLGNTPGIQTFKVKSWADSVDDDEEYGYASRHRENLILPTAPRAVRDHYINEENVPQSPPYVAYISNLSYDVDQEDLMEFFQEMKISDIRLPKDANKFKGYGYIYFEDRKSLIDALSMIDTTLKGRPIKIDLSNNSTDERRNRMGRMGDQRRDYDDDPERTTGDWRSGGRSTIPDDAGRGDRFRPPTRDDRFRSRDENRDSGFEDSKPGCWRDAPREEPRDSGTSSMERPRLSFRDRDSRPPGEERSDRDWNNFGPRRREFGEDSGADRDRWRSQPREPIDGEGVAGPPPSSSDPMRTRPKLNLNPRSKPIDPLPTPKVEGATDSTPSEEPAKRPAPASTGNIFGAARPVDTAAREREIEARLAKSSESRFKDDSGASRDGAWGRRNGVGREEERSRPAWRSVSRPYERENQDPRDAMEQRGSRDISRESRDSRGSRDARDARETEDIREPSNAEHPKDIEKREETRNSEDNQREEKGDNREPSNRATSSPDGSPSKEISSRPPPDGAEKEKKELDEEEELSRMPKATDDQAPNFVASNKYYMLPDDYA